MSTELPEDYRPRQRRGMKQQYGCIIDAEGKHWGYLIKLHNCGNPTFVNVIGRYILQLCDGSRTIPEIAKEVTKIYDVGRETAISDTDKYIRELMGLGLIESEPLLKE